MMFAQNPANEIRDFMWNFVKDGQQKENIPALKDAVYKLIKMMSQKTAGQRKDKKTDVNFNEDLDMTLWEIVIEATCLVLSGKLDIIMEDKHDKKKQKTKTERSNNH